MRLFGSSLQNCPKQAGLDPITTVFRLIYLDLKKTEAFLYNGEWGKHLDNGFNPEGIKYQGLFAPDIIRR